LRDQFVNSEPGEQELPVSLVTLRAQAPGYSADHVIVGVDSLRAPGVEEPLANVGLNGDGIVGKPDDVWGLSAVQNVQQRLAVRGRIACDGGARADDHSPAG
jgi:hypothetical protein